MWICHHPHGNILVHRVHAFGHHSPAACGPLPNDGNHGIWTGICLSVWWMSNNVVNSFLLVSFCVVFEDAWYYHRHEHIRHTKVFRTLSHVLWEFLTSSWDQQYLYTLWAIKAFLWTSGQIWIFFTFFIFLHIILIKMSDVVHGWDWGLELIV